MGRARLEKLYHITLFKAGKNPNRKKTTRKIKNEMGRLSKKRRERTRKVSLRYYLQYIIILYNLIKNKL